MIFRKAKASRMMSGLDKMLGEAAAKEEAIKAAKADVAKRLIDSLEPDTDYLIRIDSPKFIKDGEALRMEMAVKIGKITMPEPEDTDDEEEAEADQVIKDLIDSILER